MQLLTGAAGSGKTYTILAALRAALARGDSEVRLLVPTATMAQHLRDMLAREGLVFPPGVIQTLSRFVEHWAAGLPQVSEPVLQTLVEQTVRRLNLSEFSKSAHLVGFHTRLAAVFSECAAAGCDAGSLKVCQPRSGLSEAVVQVFEETRRALEDRNLGMRDTRLRVAAEGIRQAGCGSIHTVWMDGFFSLTGPEIAVVQALAGRAEVAITLPSAAIAEGTRARLLAMGFKEQVLTRSRSLPRREVFAAPSIEREADEIARRILAEAAAGRPFREIGIIVRTPETYVALLRGTLERFAIPARSYFDSVLMEQPAIRFLTGVLDAMLDGWDHAQTLTATKLAPGLGISAAMDRFDFALREKLPGAGLEPLRQLAGTTNAARLSRLLDR
ncbi:MAG TPA: AAA family ATPase, partial [Bryobacteraceae bacterium]|nr:AAA family ATPase [Bryobacteraceae bacterium]